LIEERHASIDVDTDLGPSVSGDLAHLVRSPREFFPLPGA